MSTRGTLGFRLNGQDKVTYNHSDSYPSWLGVRVLSFVRNTTEAEMTAIADKITLVDDCTPPTPEQIQICVDAGMCNLTVANQSETDWYCLMRNAQGDLNTYKTIPFMIDSANFLEDSLFCEWAYIINLDEKTLEIYKGYNKQSNGPGRYASACVDDEKRFYGVTQIWGIPLTDAQKMTDERFLEFIDLITKNPSEALQIQ
jgi:hypothetical protein